jgi:uncharacterized protein (DUF1330 family)
MAESRSVGPGVVLGVLLWPRPGREAELIAYEDAVLALVTEHGGRVVQRARSVDPERGPHPLEIHLIEFATEAGVQAYLDDERRTALAEARDAAIERTEVQRVELT